MNNMIMSAMANEANDWLQQLLAVADELHGFLDESSTLGLQPGAALVEEIIDIHD